VSPTHELPLSPFCSRLTPLCPSCCRTPLLLMRTAGEAPPCQNWGRPTVPHHPHCRPVVQWATFLPHLARRYPAASHQLTLKTKQKRCDWRTGGSRATMWGVATVTARGARSAALAGTGRPGHLCRSAKPKARGRGPQCGPAQCAQFLIFHFHL
jgi:hypothetical protein